MTTKTLQRTRPTSEVGLGKVTSNGKVFELQEVCQEEYLLLCQAQNLAAQLRVTLTLIVARSPSFGVRGYRSTCQIGRGGERGWVWFCFHAGSACVLVFKQKQDTTSFEALGLWYESVILIACCLVLGSPPASSTSRDWIHILDRNMYGGQAAKRDWRVGENGVQGATPIVYSSVLGVHLVHHSQRRGPGPTEHSNCIQNSEHKENAGDIHCILFGKFAEAFPPVAGPTLGVFNPNPSGNSTTTTPPPCSIKPFKLGTQ